MKYHGKVSGDTCNRNGCKGIMQEIDDGSSCSCQINPPCSHCDDMSYQCNICDAVVYPEEPAINIVAHETVYYKTPQEQYDGLGHDEISYIRCGHTHFSMEFRGKMPPGTDIAVVKRAIKNKEGGAPLGGRFQSFNKKLGTFTFIYYTD